MKKILFPLLAAAMLTACTHQTAQTEKDMQHLALHTQEQPNASNEWLEPVSDEQYNQVK